MEDRHNAMQSSRISTWLLAIFLLQAGADRSWAQIETPPKYEFRAAWIATVLRLDWPPSSPPATQQARLVRELDSLKAVGINAVFFQIRSEADAMYASDLEPWSYWLTAQQGLAPDPLYDPLQLAIDEAHKRGIELHAWFNPYRAVRGSGYENSEDHASRAHPDWMLSFGSLKTFNPGLPEARAHIVNVIADVATRYDIDGVHFDDYFYPYPPNHISNEDAATFAEHSRGFLDIGEWRRDNIDLLIQQVSDTLGALNPGIKFGISPFGIWKNGVPQGIVGLDAYNVIFADALTWLNEEMIDYLTPQLYWAFGGGQDYAKLASWWADQMNGRHLYPGHGSYRADAATFSGTLFAANEVPRQIRFNRDHEGILGSVFFRSKNLTTYRTKGLADSLRTDFYRTPALTPPMAWKNQTPPNPPTELSYTWTDRGTLTLAWGESAPAAKTATSALYTVYRVSASLPPDVEEASRTAANLIAVTGETELIDRPDVSDETYYYFVRSVSRNSIESDPSNVIDVLGTEVSVRESELPSFELYQNYPNPFSSSTTFQFRLDRAAVVGLRIYDVMGRLVMTRLDDQWTTVGLHSAAWDGTDDAGSHVPSGSYYYSLDVDGRRYTKGLILIR